jgi:uncharacterized protein YjbI with pentapeptide repeats
MHSRSARRAALVAAIPLTLIIAGSQTAVAQVPPPDAAGTCAIAAGFAPLSGRIFLTEGADVVGNCLQNPYADTATSNIVQPTTGGLLYWRSCDKITAFTDGTSTWLLGPNDLQSRLNTDPLFNWECISTSSAAQPAQATSTPAPAAPLPTPAPPAPTAVPVVNTGPVNLLGADLSYQVRVGVDYTNANLYHAKLVGADFSNAALTGAILRVAELTRAIFFEADLTSASLVNAFSNSGPQTPGPSFNQAKLSGAKMAFAKFPYCDLRNADVHSADLDHAILTGCDLRGADLRGVDLTEANLSYADLTGANLTGATYTGANWLYAIRTGCTGCP